MELILWRHADAEPGGADTSDLMRPLTEKGRKQARKMADWLNRHLPDDCLVLCSPAVRTMQTAQALGRHFITDAALAPDAHAEDVLRVANWPDRTESVLVIGHQPTLGHVASLLVTGAKQDWHLRKGSICWIAQRAGDEAGIPYLKALLGADLARK